MKYSIVYLDPPWDYKGQTQHGAPCGVANSTGGAASHYAQLTLAQLKTMPVMELCEKDALCYMWVTGPHLDQGIELMKALGFQYVTMAFVWDKRRVNPGYYTMSQCEFVLLGKRGRIPQPRGARNVRQMLRRTRTSHSRKPKAVARRIERMFPEQRKLELFSRRRLSGWEAWGNEVACHDSEVVQTMERWAAEVAA